MRKFQSGATRDSNDGKIAYYGFRHPLVEHSFGKYMLGHQIQADGKKREANNWWGTWDEKISIDSLVRHAEELQAIDAGYYVYRVRGFNGESSIIRETPDKNLEGFGARVSKEDVYNAIRFNAGAGLLKLLKTKDKTLKN